MTCATGHQFMAADIEREQRKAPPIRKAGREFPAWLPGAALGGLALLIELLSLVI